MSKTAAGRAGERLFQAVVALSTRFELNVGEPGTDDDHADSWVGEGWRPALAVQVKTALTRDAHGSIEATARFPSVAAVREDPSFWYAVLFVPHLWIERCWLLPSADFNRLTSRTRDARGGVSLRFSAPAGGGGRAGGFVVPPEEIGPRLARAIREGAGHPPPVAEALVVTRAAQPGP